MTSSASLAVPRMRKAIPKSRGRAATNVAAAWSSSATPGPPGVPVSKTCSSIVSTPEVMWWRRAPSARSRSSEGQLVAPWRCRSRSVVALTPTGTTNATSSSSSCQSRRSCRSKRGPGGACSTASSVGSTSSSDCTPTTSKLGQDVAFDELDIWRAARRAGKHQLALADGTEHDASRTDAASYLHGGIASDCSSGARRSWVSSSHSTAAGRARRHLIRAPGSRSAPTDRALATAWSKPPRERRPPTCCHR